MNKRPFLWFLQSVFAWAIVLGSVFSCLYFGFLVAAWISEVSA